MNNELTHWLKKGEKPKYIKKIPLGNGKYRYVYSDGSSSSGSAAQYEKDASALKAQNKKYRDKRQTAATTNYYNNMSGAIKATQRNQRYKTANENSSAVRNAAATKATQRNQRIADNAASAADRQNKALERGVRAAQSYKSGYKKSQASAETKNKSYNAGTKATQKSATQQRIANNAASAASRHNSALTKSNVYRENYQAKTSTKIRSTAQKTIRAAKNAISKGRDFLKDLFD